jgi:hypothetical protein
LEDEKSLPERQLARITLFTPCGTGSHFFVVLNPAIDPGARVAEEGEKPDDQRDAPQPRDEQPPPPTH